MQEDGKPVDGNITLPGQRVYLTKLFDLPSQPLQPFPPEIRKNLADLYERCLKHHRKDS